MDTKDKEIKEDDLEMVTGGNSHFDAIREQLKQRLTREEFMEKYFSDFIDE